jgi:hypothetical protein
MFSSLNVIEFTNFVDFSLYEWKLKRNLDLSSSEVDKLYVPQLMEELGIAAYSKDPMCTISAANSFGRINGWTTGRLTTLLSA